MPSQNVREISACDVATQALLNENEPSGRTASQSTQTPNLNSDFGFCSNKVTKTVKHPARAMGESKQTDAFIEPFGGPLRLYLIFPTTGFRQQ
jgi:hypothetical protein